MAKKTDEKRERRIAKLEAELGQALYPVSRDGRSAEVWLRFLEFVKMEKDMNSSAWHRMTWWD